MNNKVIFNERGQALVMIVLAAVVLFAFAALAIDGSMVFSDRRHAQNAADTAVLDAALAKTRGGDWETEGLERATSNGYDWQAADKEVYMYLCSWPDATCTGLPDGADPSEYIQIKIKSEINLYFARVIGIRKATNYVQAVAHAVPSDFDEMFNGNAVVGLNPDACKAVQYTGHAGTTITGGGIMVMSSCEDAAFFGNGSGTLNVPSICAVGGIDEGGVVPPSTSVTEGCTPPPAIVEPNPQCMEQATWTGNIMKPGWYNGQFPPPGVDTLQSGIYCIDGDFKLSSATLTGHGVVLRFNDGGIAWNGGDELHLSAPTEGPYKGLLIYLPSSNKPDNCSTITLNGNSASTIVGSILAPCSTINIQGTGDSGIIGQIIGDMVNISGDAGTNIHYDDALNLDTLNQPWIEFNQ
jgi:hypothetical protein